MSFFKFLIGDVTINAYGDKSGHLFNNTLFNVSTSTIGTGFTGRGKCLKVTAKAIPKDYMLRRLV